MRFPVSHGVYIWVLDTLSEDDYVVQHCIEYFFGNHCDELEVCSALDKALNRGHATVVLMDQNGAVHGENRLIDRVTPDTLRAIAREDDGKSIKRAFSLTKLGVEFLESNGFTGA